MLLAYFWLNSSSREETRNPLIKTELLTQFLTPDEPLESKSDVWLSALVACQPLIRAFADKYQISEDEFERDDARVAEDMTILFSRLGVKSISFWLAKLVCGVLIGERGFQWAAAMLELVDDTHFTFLKLWDLACYRQFGAVATLDPPKIDLHLEYDYEKLPWHDSKDEDEEEIDSNDPNDLGYRGGSVSISDSDSDDNIIDDNEKAR